MFSGIPSGFELSELSISLIMEIEKVQNTSPSKKRNMDNIDEWIKKVRRYR